MLEFHPNTLAFMTASLEHCCKKLGRDTPEARKFVAERLKQCARAGKTAMADLTMAGENAVTELNRSLNAGSTSWRDLFQLKVLL